MSKNWWVVIIIVILIALAGWWFFSSQQTETQVTSGGNITPSVTQELTAPASPVSESTTSGGTADTKEEILVRISSSGFSPKTLTIKAGETITWMNDDTANHNVNSAPHPVHTDYQPLNLGSIQPGGTKSLTFPVAGTYKYHDHLNPTLFASITVE